MKQSVNDTFLEVLLGGAITAGFTWLLDFLKSRREEKVYIKRKREAVYKNILDVYYTYRQEINKGIDNTDILSSLPHLLERNYADINIYGSNNIKGIYNKIMKSKDNKEDLLIKAIRNEICVKDYEN